MNRLTVTMIAVILALSAGLWYSIRAGGAVRAERDAAVQALRVAEKQRKSDAALLTRRAGEVLSERRKSATAMEALNQAQKATPERGATPTPPEVKQALEGAVEGLE